MQDSGGEDPEVSGAAQRLAVLVGDQDRVNTGLGASRGLNQESGGDGASHGPVVNEVYSVALPLIGDRR